MIVLPPDFSHVGELVKALISFSRDNDNKDKKISIPLEIEVRQGNLIEVYLDQDDVLLSLANNLPIEITMDIGPK
jgi:hypothetical protein